MTTYQPLDDNLRDIDWEIQCAERNRDFWARLTEENRCTYFSQSWGERDKTELNDRFVRLSMLQYKFEEEVETLRVLRAATITTHRTPEQIMAEEQQHRQNQRDYHHYMRDSGRIHDYQTIKGI